MPRSYGHLIAPGAIDDETGYIDCFRFYTCFRLQLFLLFIHMNKFKRKVIQAHVVKYRYVHYPIINAVKPLLNNVHSILFFRGKPPVLMGPTHSSVQQPKSAYLNVCLIFNIMFRLL